MGGDFTFGGGHHANEASVEWLLVPLFRRIADRKAKAICNSRDSVRNPELRGALQCQEKLVSKATGRSGGLETTVAEVAATVAERVLKFVCAFRNGRGSCLGFQCCREVVCLFGCPSVRSKPQSLPD